MANISQPKCPKCKSHKYKIIDGPQLSKTQYGSDVKEYLLQCLEHNCNKRYKWFVPLRWKLENSPQ